MMEPSMTIACSNWRRTAESERYTRAWRWPTSGIGYHGSPRSSDRLRATASRLQYLGDASYLAQWRRSKRRARRQRADRHQSMKPKAQGSHRRLPLASAVGDMVDITSDLARAAMCAY